MDPDRLSVGGSTRGRGAAPRYQAGNVIVTDKGAVKVLDFGIAKLARRENTQATTLTEVGTIVGTVAYMSPEQTRGEALDGRSDVFSLGCLLYRAATGTLPFYGVNALALVHAIATSHPPAPSTVRNELPPAFDELVLRCLSKPASQRPTAEEAGTALLQIAHKRRRQPSSEWTGNPSLSFRSGYATRLPKISFCPSRSLTR